MENYQLIGIHGIMVRGSVVNGGCRIISVERRGRWGARWATAAASPSRSARSVPRSRRGYLLHPFHEGWTKPFPVRSASWNAPNKQTLDIQSPKAMLSGALSGNILVSKLVSDGCYVRESLSSEGLAAGILDSTFN